MKKRSTLIKARSWGQKQPQVIFSWQKWLR